MRPLALLACLWCCPPGGAAADTFEPLFNGQNLDGWVRVNTAPSTWTVQDGMLVCSGKPTGQLRTRRMYQNFILEVEWRHLVPRGNGGIFVWADDITARGVPFHRSIEVQVLENAYGNTRGYSTHGDIFPIHGATMTPINGRGGSRAFPTENRSRPSPQWNHYRIECRDGAIALAVNGKIVTRGEECIPRKGYICLESEGGVVHYRNMRIQELPDSPVADEHVAIADRGFVCLYNGIDLEGWQVQGDWQPRDWVLKGLTDGSLETAAEYEPRGFLFDVRATEILPSLVLHVGGLAFRIDSSRSEVADHLADPGAWNRFEVARSGRALSVQLNGVSLPEVAAGGASTLGPLRLETAGPIDLANLYVR